MRIPNVVFGHVLLKLPQETLIPAWVRRLCRTAEVTERELKGMWGSPLAPTDVSESTSTTFKYVEMTFILDCFSFSSSSSGNVKNKSETLRLKAFL